MGMAREKIKRSMLSQLIPGIASLAKRGLAGWLVLFGAILTAAIIVMTLISPWISPYNPTALSENLLLPPSSQFLFGTDDLGRDMFSRVLSGGGIMLQVSIISVLVCMMIGIPLGLFSSYTGGAV